MKNIVKKHSILSVLMCSILGSQICCGADISEVQSIWLAKVEKSGLRVFSADRNSDFNNIYKISLETKSNCIRPIVSFFGADKDTEINNCYLQKTEQTITLDEETSLWKISCTIENFLPTHYQVEFSSNNGEACERMEGTMPELEISLDPETGENGSRKLKLSNKTKHTISLTGIEKTRNTLYSKYIGIKPEDLTNKSIVAGESLEVDFNPDITCSPEMIKQVGVSQFYKFRIGYKIGNATDEQADKHKFEIYVYRVCKDSGGDSYAQGKRDEYIKELSQLPHPFTEQYIKKAVGKIKRDIIHAINIYCNISREHVSAVNALKAKLQPSLSQAEEVNKKFNIIDDAVETKFGKKHVEFLTALANKLEEVIADEKKYREKMDKVYALIQEYNFIEAYGELIEYRGKRIDNNDKKLHDYERYVNYKNYEKSWEELKQLVNIPYPWLHSYIDKKLIDERITALYYLMEGLKNNDMVKIHKYKLSGCLGLVGYAWGAPTANELLKKAKYLGPIPVEVRQD